MTHKQQYYLQQMGIDVWLPRQVKTSSSNLSQLADTVATCQQCPLHQTRTQTVFARGNPKANLMIIGEAPGYYEDQQGLPFVGKAGGLLNQMLKSIHLSDQDVYIANVLKCRPPNNRDPNTDEIACCQGYLKQQITLVAPKLILAVGRFAGQFLLKKTMTLAQMRQHIHQYENIPVIVSYHPAYLLRNTSDKKKAFQDLQQIKRALQKIEASK